LPPTTPGRQIRDPETPGTSQSSGGIPAAPSAAAPQTLVEVGELLRESESLPEYSLERNSLGTNTTYGKTFSRNVLGPRAFSEIPAFFSAQDRTQQQLENCSCNPPAHREPSRDSENQGSWQLLASNLPKLTTVPQK